MILIPEIKEREEYQVWRKRNRVRLKDIALYCKCGLSTLSMWENGLLNVSGDIINLYNDYIKKFNEGKIYAENQRI